jgi:hypothetical protein
VAACDGTERVAKAMCSAHEQGTSLPSIQRRFRKTKTSALEVFDAKRDTKRKSGTFSTGAYYYCVINYECNKMDSKEAV